jgi:hypothetical protein
VGDMVDRLRACARVLVATLVLGGAVVGGAALAEPAAAQADEPPPRPTDLTIPFPDDVDPAQSRAERVPTPEPGVQAAAGCDPDVWTDTRTTNWWVPAGYTLYYACDEGLWVAGVALPGGGMRTVVFHIDTDANVDGNGCQSGDYVAVADIVDGTWVAAVYRTPTCDASTWTSMGDAYFDEYVSGGSRYFDISFVGAQIGSPTSVAYSGYARAISGGEFFFPSTGYRTAWRPVPTYPAPVVAPAGGARLAESHSIFRLYSAYLLRQPDTSGLSYWEDQYLTCGQGLAGVSAFFAGSPEFTGRYGTVTDAEFVDLIYANVLGRAPEVSGFAYWVGQLADGAANRGQVMVGFSESNEYVARTGTVAPQTPLCGSRAVSDSVYRLYRAYFLREPEAEGERYWTARYNRCESRLTAISNLFANSDEFMARYGSLPNRAFVELVYQNVLGRPGEASGIDYWNDRVTTGDITRGGMMIGFSDSPEFVGRTGTRAPVAPC